MDGLRVNHAFSLGRIGCAESVRNLWEVGLIDLNPKDKLSVRAKRPLSYSVHDDVPFTITFQFQCDIRLNRHKLSNACEVAMQDPNFFGECH